MSSSLSSESALPPKLDVNVGAKSHFYHPPKKSALENLQQSTISGTKVEAKQSSCRKRSRHESDFSTPATPFPHRWVALSEPTTPNTVSPPPLVSTRYKLFGQEIKTPTATATSSNDVITDCEAPFAISYRRDIRESLFLSGCLPVIPSVSSREENGRGRQYVTCDGWGKTFYRVAGAAGKIWDFCKTSAFKGFYAGGGQGYAMNSPIYSKNQVIRHHMDAKSSILGDDGHNNLVPGCFPEKDYIPDYMLQDHSTPPRAAKKVQRSKGEGDLRSSWIMVGATPIPSRESSPTKFPTRKVPSPSMSRQRLHLRAKGRLQVQPASRPSLTSHAGSPGMRSDRPASFASSRSPVTSPKHESPVSVDVQRHAARIRRRELEEQAHLKRFNKQLKAMIREGKEALRTTIDIEDEETDSTTDEGYVEGEYCDEMYKY